ncbi:hypothetical protein QYF36_024719 [Acer negundo]|nr:hypothetical protein QYF36_024719 [Acer negundo]
MTEIASTAPMKLKRFEAWMVRSSERRGVFSMRDWGTSHERIVREYNDCVICVEAQESVLTTILDIQFLRTPLKEVVEDEVAMDFLLDEVIIAASERCLDPNPLEPPILDKLIQAKLAKTKEKSPMSP